MPSDGLVPACRLSGAMHRRGFAPQDDLNVPKPPVSFASTVGGFGPKGSGGGFSW